MRVSLFLVEHEPDAVADTRSGAGDRQSSDLEAQAESLERKAAELRRSAERLSDRARLLRTMARQLRGDLSSNGSCPDDCADPRRAKGSRRRAVLDLTPRQREIVRLIACGRTNRQIAQELVITVGTAANHVAQVLDRLGLDNRAQVAAWAVEHREIWHNPNGGMSLRQARLE
jgi:DNA-binding NarL/FixJ family response regulator